MNKLLIYNPTPSPRLDYIFELLFKQIIGIAEIEQVDNILCFSQAKNVAKLNYSKASMANIPFFVPDSFMLETGIRTLSPVVKLSNKMPAAFFHNHPKAIIPFDVFAWCFYLVSRYEEYLDFEADLHGRFCAHQSLAYQNDFLSLPVVNLWAKKIAFILQVKFPKLEMQPPSYQYTPSYDIDHAYAFLKKGVIRQTGAMLRNIKNRSYETLKLQFKTWFRIQKDPYQTFDYLKQLDQQYDLKPHYFWLVGDHGEYDKNIHHQNKHFRRLVASSAQQFSIGIHPSYGSNTSPLILDKEIARLEDMSQQKIISSRQHFLKLHLPQTYQNLVHYNVKEDYSMGYAQELGFRASITTPFYWFDLSLNKATDLLIYPFQVMDVTLNTYQGLSPEAATEKVLPIIQQTQAVDGHFISLWHNSSLCEAWQWKGWRQVYETLIEKAKK